MPEVLELKPLKDKILKLIMVESEFPIDWWFEVPEEKKEELVWNLHLISKEYLDLINTLVQKYEPDFALEEHPNYLTDSPDDNDPLKSLFKSKNIPFKNADISENAESYLSSALDGHKEAIKKLEQRIKETIEKKGGKPEKDEQFQQLMLWKEYLKRDYSEQEDEIRYKVREAWMMMNILNLARDISKIADKKKIKAMFICDPKHFEGLEKLTEDLGIETEKIKIKRAIKTEEIEKELEQEIEIKETSKR